MDNIVNFKKPIIQDQTMDTRYLQLIELVNLREKHWSHICIGVGMVTQKDAVCPRCLQTKPKEK